MNDGNLIKAILTPKVSIGFEKTVQVKQFEPIKVSVFISAPIDEEVRAKIKHLLKIAEEEVTEKLKNRGM